jgi:hypothetical protein
MTEWDNKHIITSHGGHQTKLWFSITCFHTTQQKLFILDLFGHYTLALSSKYLEEKDGHFVSHLQCPIFDAALHQHIV